MPELKRSGCPGDPALKAYVDDELRPNAAVRVEVHLERCVACAESVAWLQQIAAGLGVLEGAVAPPEGLRSRILARLEAVPTPAPRRRLNRFDLIRWASLAAGLAVALCVIAGLLLPPPDRRSAAMTNLRQIMAAVKLYRDDHRVYPDSLYAKNESLDGDRLLVNKLQVQDGHSKFDQDHDETYNGKIRFADRSELGQIGRARSLRVQPAPLTKFGAVPGRPNPFLETHDVKDVATSIDPYTDMATSRSQAPPDGSTRAALNQRNIKAPEAGAPRRRNGDPYSPSTASEMSARQGDFAPGDVSRYARGQAVDALKRKVVHGADLSVRVDKKLETAQDAVAAWVKAQGGYVERAEMAAGQTGPRVGQMALRVPVDRFDAALTHFSAMGEVLSKNLQGEDVTGQWIDERSEVRLLREKETRLIRQYETARKAKVREQARQQLLELRPELRAAEEKFALTSKLAALAQIRLTLTEEPQARVRGNLLQDLQNTGRAALSAFVVALRIPAAILIWLVVFTPLWLPCVLVYRWAARKARVSG